MADTTSDTLVMRQNDVSATESHFMCSFSLSTLSMHQATEIERGRRTSWVNVREGEARGERERVHTRLEYRNTHSHSLWLDTIMKSLAAFLKFSQWNKCISPIIQYPRTLSLGIHTRSHVYEIARVRRTLLGCILFFSRATLFAPCFSSFCCSCVFFFIIIFAVLLPFQHHHHRMHRNAHANFFIIF